MKLITLLLLILAIYIVVQSRREGKSIPHFIKDSIVGGIKGLFKSILNSVLNMLKP
jgi:hypothetical protein